jgi:hypothetical protein
MYPTKIQNDEMSGMVERNSDPLQLMIHAAFPRRVGVVGGVVRVSNPVSAASASGSGSASPAPGRVWIPFTFATICKDSFSRMESLKWIAFEADSKVSGLESGAFCESGLVAIHIPGSVEVICESCFSLCTSLTSVVFSVDCKLSRLEGRAFSGSGLVAFVIPGSVEVFCEECFSECTSLTSAVFSIDCKLLRL